MFAALLDDENGRRFRIRLAGTDYTAKQTYLPDTAVLVTRFYGEALDLALIDAAVTLDTALDHQARA